MNVVTMSGRKVHAVKLLLWGSAFTRCGLEVPNARAMEQAASELQRPRTCRKCRPKRKS